MKTTAIAAAVLNLAATGEAFAQSELAGACTAFRAPAAATSAAN